MASLIFGIHGIEEALNSGQEIDKIFIEKHLDSKAVSRILGKAKSQKIGISRVPTPKLNKLTSGNHQGMVATIAPISTLSLEALVEQGFAHTPTPLFLLCDGISDVRNFGAIVRTAECAGIQGIIIPKQGSAALNDQVVKTSSGAFFNMPICKTNHLKDAVYFLKSYAVQIISATEKSRDSLYAIDFKQASAVIMGSEGKGVSKALLKMSDIRAKIPLLGQTESLNVSVAGALFLYESVRQKEA